MLHVIRYRLSDRNDIRPVRNYTSATQCSFWETFDRHGLTSSLSSDGGGGGGSISKWFRFVLQRPFTKPQLTEPKKKTIS